MHSMCEIEVENFIVFMSYTIEALNLCLSNLRQNLKSLILSHTLQLSFLVLHHRTGLYLSFNDSAPVSILNE